MQLFYVAFCIFCHIYRGSVFIFQSDCVAAEVIQASGEQHNPPFSYWHIRWRVNEQRYSDISKN